MTVFLHFLFSELVIILLAKIMNADTIEAAASVSSTEIKEAIEDNLHPTKLKKDDVGGVSSRTLAYTLAMILVVFWMATLNIAFIPRIQLINQTGGEYTWAYIHDMLKNLIIYMFVPLLIILREEDWAALSLPGSHCGQPASPACPGAFLFQL